MSKHLLHTFKAHLSPIKCIAFSPDGKILASGADNQCIKLWDTLTQKPIASLVGHYNGIISLTFSPDGKTLASTGWDRTIRIWDVVTGVEIASIDKFPWVNRSVSFSPDGKILAFGGYHETIRLWDIANQKEVAVLEGHSEYIHSLAFSPDGKTLASGSSDATVKLWYSGVSDQSHTSFRKEIATLIPCRFSAFSHWVTSVAFSPDGKTLAAGNSGGIIKLWDVLKREEINILQGSNTYDIKSMAFSPDGKILVSASNDGNIKLWDVAMGELIDTFTDDSAGVYSVAFSPDGKTLASSSFYNIKLWDVSFIYDNKDTLDVINDNKTEYRVFKRIEDCKTTENPTSLNELDDFNKSLSVELLSTHKKGSYYFNTSSKEEFANLVYIFCCFTGIAIAFILVVTGVV